MCFSRQKTILDTFKLDEYNKIALVENAIIFSPQILKSQLWVFPSKIFIEIGMYLNFGILVCLLRGMFDREQLHEGCLPAMYDVPHLLRAVARYIKLGSASSKFADWWAWLLGVACYYHTHAYFLLRG